MIVHGMLICISFLINVRMFIVLKALLISSATVIVRAKRAIWLSPSTTVLIKVCLLLCKEEGASPVSTTTERRDMGLYEVPLSIFFVGFWDGDYVSQLPYVWYFIVKSGLKHDREE